jgi:hypothetical protein
MVMEPVLVKESADAGIVKDKPKTSVKSASAV